MEVEARTMTTPDVIGAIIAGDNTFRGARSALPEAPVVPDDPEQPPSALRRWAAARLADLAVRLDPDAARPRITHPQRG
jgi:hypothetical protein